MQQYIQDMQTLIAVMLYACAGIGLFTIGVRAYDFVSGYIQERKLRALFKFYAEHPAIERKRQLPADMTTEETPTFELRPCSDEELVEPLYR